MTLLDNKALKKGTSKNLLILSLGPDIMHYLGNVIDGSIKKVEEEQAKVSLLG